MNVPFPPYFTSLYSEIGGFTIWICNRENLSCVGTDLQILSFLYPELLKKEAERERDGGRSQCDKEPLPQIGTTFFQGWVLLVINH